MLVLVSLAGCGYHTLGSAAHLPPDVHTLAIPVFMNQTQFYRTETVMTEAVQREFTDRTRLTLLTRDGADADATLHGTILEETIQPLTYRTDAPSVSSGQNTSFTSSFLVTINANVTVTARDGRILYRHTNYLYHTQFETTSDLTSFIEEDSPAVERLSHDFAQALVSDILESF